MIRHEAEIVGVVGDVTYHSPETSMMPDVYLCSLQGPGGGILAIRAVGAARACPLDP